MKRWALAAGICTAVFVSCDKEDELNDTDRMYVNMASVSNNAEVMAGQVAAAKGNNPMVKMFGQQMVQEHTLAQNDLKSRAANAGLSAHDSVDAEHRAMMAYLNGLSGYSFDTAYMNSQVKDHAKTIELFNTEINNGSHPFLRSYASQYLPNIQMHHTRADSIRKAL